MKNEALWYPSKNYSFYFLLCFGQNRLQFMQCALHNTELPFTWYSCDAYEFKQSCFSRNAGNLWYFFLELSFFQSAISCDITLSDDDDVPCAMVLPGNFSDGYCTGADCQIQILLLWNLKEEVKRPEQNSTFTSVIVQSYARKLTFLSIDCVHLPQQSAFIDNYLLVLNQSYVKHEALLSGRVNNIDSILKWIRHRRN